MLKRDLLVFCCAGLLALVTVGCGDDDPPAPLDSGICGNGVVEGSEECDDGNALDTDLCLSTCINPVCGDGIVSGAEDCDDGNEVDDDDCSNSCAANNLDCGNDVIDEGEDCDDGNQVSGDGCDSDCQLEETGPECETSDDCDPSAMGLTACEIAVCDGVTGKCVAGSSKNFTACDDGDPCNTDSVCVDGSCTGGSATSCDDGNACTDDACDPASGDCLNENNTAPCDDGNPCTDTDICGGGSCAGTAAECPCTTDLDCDQFDDDDLCNGSLSCNDDGQCVVDTATVVLCDTSADGACQQTACNPTSGTCETGSVTDGSSCSDGNPCTIDDACVGGACEGDAQDCPCTSDDECADFDDGNACNGTAACIAGGCGVDPASVVTCADTGDACTTSVCDPSSGACEESAVAAGTACDDGDACTWADSCGAGGCAGAAADCADSDPCTENEECDADTGGCTSTAVDCADEDNCTLDICDSDADGCSNPAKDCDDSDACTTDGCDADTGDCTNAAVDCDDSNPCTDDSCDAATGACVNALVACDDGDACTTDWCDEATGDCMATDVVCDDDGDPCTNEACDSDAGGCESTPKDCDDDDECTGDSCEAASGDCVHVAGDCSDGDDCTVDTCDPATGLCDSLNTCCVEDGECDDDDECTTDTCDDDGACLFESIDGCEVVQDCCVASDTDAGCSSDAELEACVCGLDDFCCDVVWDFQCANTGATECDSGCPACGDDACDEGENCLDCPGDCGVCEPCGNFVCDDDEDCSSCPEDCGACEGDCCTDNGSPGCDDAEVVACVCAIDPFCCTTEWDIECANHADNACDVACDECGDGVCGADEDCLLCADDCGACEGDCCSGGDTPGCFDAEVTACVCALDAFCCTDLWDVLCVELASEDCGACAPDACGDGTCSEEDGEDCAACPDDCGACEGDCCLSNDSIGCDDPDITACVCGADAFCCENVWDNACAGAANNCGGECPVCGDGTCEGDEGCDDCFEDCGQCEGDCCEANGTPGCDDFGVSACICEADSFCCQLGWDDSCAEAATSCGAACGDCGDGTCDDTVGESCETCTLDCGSCAGDCCEAGDDPGCDDPDVTACVCEADIFCCSTTWDEFCAGAANSCDAGCPVCGDGACEDGEDCSSCADDCGDCEGDCCSDNGGEAPGCSDPDVTSCVCEQDPFCCDNTWDQLCADAANSCGAGCPVCGDGTCEGDETCVDCAEDCGDCAGDCCADNGGDSPGCDDINVSTCVCADDAFCCQVTWDGACADGTTACGGACGDCGDGTCGDDESCQSCPLDCGACEGDCCFDNGEGSPGCGDPVVNDCVCGADPFCCDTTFDDVCAGLAADECGAECPLCGDGACEGGEGCHNCELDCGECVAADCCVPNAAGIGCGDPGVTACVCASDAFCCQVTWDAACVANANDSCGADCPDPCGDGICDDQGGETCATCELDCGACEGSCCAENGSAGCDDAECQASVCEIDPFCCDTTYDDLCAGCAAGAPGVNGADCSGTADACGYCDACGDGTCDEANGESCESCPDDCGVCPGDCCEAGDYATCADADCSVAVCELDAFCCDVNWDETCASCAAGEVGDVDCSGVIDACQQCQDGCTLLFSSTVGAGGEEIALQIVDSGGLVYIVGQDFVEGQVIEVPLPLPTGSYTVEMFDAGGDGWGDTTLTITDADGTIILDGVTLEDGSEGSVDFFNDCAAGTCGDAECGGLEDCATCEDDCGLCPGDCCTASGGPGCFQDVCSDAVCALDAYCCDVEWDETCAACAGGQVTESADCTGLTDDVCAQCDPCGDGVCDAEGGEDCDTCGLDCGACPGSCCVDSGGAGCTDEACQAAVCELDGYCCETAWDNLCAGCAHGEPGFDGLDCSSAVEACAVCDACGDGTCDPDNGEDCGGCEADCGVCAGSCCDDGGDAVGCTEPACEEAVCGIDPFCCDAGWDENCAACAAGGLGAGGVDCAEAVAACPLCQPGCPVTLIVDTVAFGNEISWMIVDPAGTVFAAGPDEAYGNDDSYDHEIELPPGEFFFVMIDSFGDGWNGGSATLIGTGGVEYFVGLTLGEGESEGGAPFDHACLECAEGEIADCAGLVCVDEALLGDGNCDEALACGFFGWDGGDCDIVCDEDQLPTCDGTDCLPATWLGDTVCDEGYDCDGYAYDEGDCGECGDANCNVNENPTTCPDDCGPSACDDPEIDDCAGGCSDGTLLGDGICDDAFNCPLYDNDGGDCCAEGTIPSCDGDGCMPESWLGDGICDSGLNCDEYAADAGDCCPEGEVKDCNGACADPIAIGDGTCDEGWQCDQHDWDGGDCPVVCDEDRVISCDGTSCVLASWVGDGICDGSLNCDTYAYDGGDCPFCGDGICADDENPTLCPEDCGDSGCGPDAVDDCDGGCYDGTLLGDGTCDGALNCEAWNHDDGDCCPDGQQHGCDGECILISWLGDDFCDAGYECEEFNFDEGDCEVPLCDPGFVASCDGTECLDEALLGDGNCDELLNCDITGYDDGDCEPPVGSCCETNDTPGCDEPGCQDAVCALDGFCCDTSWDVNCANCASIGVGFGDLDCSGALEACSACQACGPDEIVGCDGETCVAADWVGDGICDDSLACTDTNWDGGDCPIVCDLGEVPNCDATACHPETWVGDDICDSGLDCEAYGYDGGDCPYCGDAECGADENPSTCPEDCGDSACPPGMVDNCEGTGCVPDTIGDGTCDAELQCDAYGLDGGDCCPVDDMFDCNGECTLASWLGDGFCDEGFDCEEFGFDDGDCVEEPVSDCCAPSAEGVGGCSDIDCAAAVCALDAFCCSDLWDQTCADCASGGEGFGGIDCSSTFEGGCNECWTCAPGDIIGCDGESCVDATWLGDGICDGALACPEHGFDAGDCPVTCAEDEVLGCDGVTCILASWLGDGLCDAALECEETGWDDGDCCPAGMVSGCYGGCIDETLIGDGGCDPGLFCADYADDDGDCTGCIVNVTVFSGQFASEIGWIIIDSATGAELASAGPDLYEDGGEATMAIALESGDYEFIMTDVFGDGWNGGSAVITTLEGTILVDATLDDGEIGSAAFTLDCDATGPACPEGEIENCAGDGCVPATWLGDGVCDSSLDCEGYGLDDGDCCPEGEVTACDGLCIDETFVGDGFCDEPLACAAFDYDGGDCEVTCEPGTVLNCNEDGCLPDNWLADDFCDSGLNCEAHAYDAGDCEPPGECAVGEYTCSDGACIQGDWECDGFDDCSDAGDEAGCPCAPDEYTCSDGACIQGDWECDGFEDCSDAGDEAGCPVDCAPDEFQCSDGACIPGAAECDGTEDCSDAGDEAGCPVDCAPDEYTCSDGACIQGDWECDGFEDCSDGGDEAGCPCLETEYTCSDGACIQADWECDGFDDCSDAGDEVGCLSPPPGEGDLVITEFMADPDLTGDADGEYVEVYNPTDSTFDLSTVTLRDDDGESTVIDASVPIGPDEYVVLGRSADIGGGVAPDYIYSGFQLANGGDEIVLEVGGTIIDSVVFTSGTFPVAAGASASYSPEAMALGADNNDGTNWCESSTPFGAGDLGTPGSANDSCAPQPPAAPTYADVQPIFVANCSGCHNAGSSGGHSIASSYASAQGPSYYCPGKTKAECTIERILDGSMPLGAPGSVPQADVDTIQAWVDAGTPEF